MLIKSRSVRIAVNVCVIGALLVPYTALGATLTSACDSAIASTHKCEGCGRCSVANTGDRCSCCQKRPARNAKPDKTCCIKQKCCNSSTAALSANMDSTQSEIGSCQCGRRPQPTTPPLPTRSAAEKLNELLSVSAVIHVCHVDGEAQFSTQDLEIIPLTLLPLDSLRHLCVWRI